MNNVLKSAVSMLARWKEPEPPVDSERLGLIHDIREVSQNLENAYSRFEFESDGDLIESCIYEIEALKARYRYLLQRVREMDESSAERRAVLDGIRDNSQ